jgi:hypothetical protein
MGHESSLERQRAHLAIDSVTAVTAIREDYLLLVERVAGPEARQCRMCRVATLVRVPLLRPHARAPPNPCLLDPTRAPELCFNAGLAGSSESNEPQIGTRAAHSAPNREDHDELAVGHVVDVVATCWHQ